ncbi:MAG TPA: HWE histidine kinase domain-containing protein, partial [Phenylobacterium sp.]
MPDESAAHPQSLEESARLADVLEAVSDGFYALDAEWRYVMFNAAAEEYFGVSRDLVLGKSMWDVFPQGKGTPFEAACRRAMDAGQVSTFEAPSLLRAGHTVELRIAPLRGVGVAVLVNDVTERKAAEGRMQLMINELNHRVKNSMAVIQGLARQSFATAASVDQAREDFTGRLVAFAAAHDVVSDQNWEGADLHDLIGRTLAGQVQDPVRMQLSGAAVRVSPKAALSLALALHELA